MIGYEIEIKGLEEQIKKLQEFAPMADRHLRTAMNQSVITIEGEAKGLAPVGVSGRLRNSLASEVTSPGPLSIVGRVGSTLRDEVYPAVMEFGRKPGRPPPSSALERWVHIVLGVGGDEARSVAFLVARAIGRRGIKGKFFMRDAWSRSKDRVNRYFSLALERIAQGLSNGRQ